MGGLDQKWLWLEVWDGGWSGLFMDLFSQIWLPRSVRGECEKQSGTEKQQRQSWRAGQQSGTRPEWLQTGPRDRRPEAG